MKSLYSLFVPIYFLVAFKLWSPFATDNAVPRMPWTTETKASTEMMLTVVAGSNSPQCTGATLDLHATPSGGTAPYTYSWSGPNGFTSNAPTPSIANVTTLANGTYHVTVIDGTTAMATASIDVTINPAATTDAGPNQILCRNANAQLAGVIGGGASSGTWSSSVPGGTFIPNANTLNAQYDPPNNYSGQVILTLTTNDPAGPCGAVNDQMMIRYGNPDALVCNDQVTLAMDEDCTVTITADMLLEGDVPEELYQVGIFNAQGQSLGTEVTSQHIGSTVIGRVRDICTGNVCFTNIHVVDNIAPIITCQDIFLPCAIPNYTPEYIRDVLGISTAFPTVNENCSIYTLTKFDTWVDVGCNEVVNGHSGISGYMRRVWTAKDASNNSTSCTQYIYFQRLPISSFQLPLDATVSCEAMNANPMVTGVPTYSAFGMQFPLSPSSSFCEVSATYQDQVVSNCAGTSSIIRTWTIFDLCGSAIPGVNPIVHVQIINKIDPNGPEFECPDDMTISTNSLNCCAITNLPDVIMEDHCSYVRDAKAIIKIKNQFTGDVISTVAVDATLTTFPGNNPIHGDTLAVFPNSPCLPVGTHEVTYEAEDACGAISSCTFNITVEDAMPPLAICDEFTKVALGIDGTTLVLAETFDDGSYDNCSPVYFKVRRQDTNSCQPNNKFYDAVQFCCSDIGDTISVIMRVYDVPVLPGAVNLDYEEQHSNDCVVQVLVEDKLKPVCVPPANVTVSCELFDPTFWAHGQPQGIDNCCLDTVTTTVNYASFDTICNRGTITRNFRVTDCSGNFNTCTQRITVNYTQQYFVKFPDDVVITACDGTGSYGQPQFYGEDCELLASSYQDAVFTLVPDACYKIERTWTVINWCSYDPNSGCTFVPNPNPSTTPDHINNLTGPTVSAAGTPGAWAPTVMKLTPTDPTPTNFATFYAQNTNCYKYKQLIKIVDVQKPVINCPTANDICDYTMNDTMLWNQKFFVSPSNTKDLCEAPADVCVSGTDACSGNNVTFRYILLLDLNNDGIMETAINSLNPPANGTVNYGNAALPGYNGGTNVIFDKRPVSAGQRYGWTMQTTTSGNNVTACIKWNTANAPGTFITPELPVGKHKVKWFISDGCGNESACEYKFEIKDCKNPTIICRNGFSVNNMLQSGVTMYASTFLEEVSDNCTPTNLIKIGIRKSGTGSGFPFLADGVTPQTSVTFTCAELGTQLVEIWAIDQAGNADFCETYVLVQDNTGTCGQNVTVAGALNTESGNGIEDTYMELTGGAVNGIPNLNMFSFTDYNGSFSFNNALPVSAGYTLMPQKDNDPLNGVNTYDLVLISRHILGIEPLNTPYKLIAADVNKSGTVTTFDMVELRKLLLGTYTELPNNSAWRFVDENFTFANPDNPFAQPIPETRTYASAMGNMMDENFVGVKVGDVDNSNMPNHLVAPEDRAAKTVFFELEDQLVQPGDIVTATLKCAEDILAYQMTLQLGDVQLMTVEPGNLQTEEHFALFPERKAVTCSWDGNGRPEFKVRFRSNVHGKLSDLLNVSSLITRAEAYDVTETKTDIALRFLNVNGENVVSSVGFELYQNQPNPFLTKTVIGFNLPEEADATLTVFDDAGRTVMTKKGHYAKGYNRVLFDTEKIEATASMLYYRIETGNYTATRKMVKTK